MRPLARVVSTTVIGGVLFLMPLLIVLWLVKQAVALTHRALSPVAHLFPGDLLGVAMIDVAVLLAILAVCFVAGLIARTAMGQDLNRRLEHVILGRIPGFTLVKSAAQGLMGLQSRSDVESALAMVEDAWVPAFVMEHHADGIMTVFVPSVPTPAAGTVYMLGPERVRILENVPVTSMVSVVMRLGVGLRDVVEASARA
jgi:uncharacterized membrane protein